MTEHKSGRRRGDELLESLFDATLQLMDEVKPASLTFQQIAEVANTSRTVLYRRWPTVFDLLQDVYIYRARKLFEGDFFNQLADSGSLRGDLMSLLTLYQHAYEEVGADTLNNYYYLRMQDKDDLQEPPIHARAVDAYLNIVRSILEKARVRGERVKQVSSVTLMLPFDLIRVENLIRRNTIDQKRISLMVDEVLMPVFCDKPGGTMH